MRVMDIERFLKAARSIDIEAVHAEYAEHVKWCEETGRGGPVLTFQTFVDAALWVAYQASEEEGN